MKHGKIKKLHLHTVLAVLMAGVLAFSPALSYASNSGADADGTSQAQDGAVFAQGEDGAGARSTDFDAATAISDVLGDESASVLFEPESSDSAATDEEISTPDEQATMGIEDVAPAPAAAASPAAAADPTGIPVEPLGDGIQLLAVTPVTTEAELRNALSNTSVTDIELANNITLTTDTLALPARSVTIDGAGYTLSLAPTATFRHFYYNNPGSWAIVMKNLTLQGNNSGIPDASNLASRVAGGGIEIKNAASTTLALENCILRDCHVAGNGAAVNFSSYSSVTLTDCKFLNNSATGAGGAYTHVSTNTRATRVVFENNYSGYTGAGAGQGGGAIYLNRQNGTATQGAIFDTCTFTNNRAANIGGAIASYSCQIAANTCTFTGNSANEGGAVGGSTISYLMVDGCAFSDNHALGVGSFYNGGAIEITSSSSNVTIKDSDFIGNTSGNDGGAIYLPSSAATIRGGTFKENVAKRNGGAIHVPSTYTGFKVDSTIFENNIAEAGYAGWSTQDPISSTVSGTTSPFNQAGLAVTYANNVTGVTTRSAPEAPLFEGDTILNNYDVYYPPMFTFYVYLPAGTAWSGVVQTSDGQRQLSMPNAKLAEYWAANYSLTLTGYKLVGFDTTPFGTQFSGYADVLPLVPEKDQGIFAGYSSVESIDTIISGSFGLYPLFAKVSALTYNANDGSTATFDAGTPFEGENLTAPTFAATGLTMPKYDPDTDTFVSAAAGGSDDYTVSFVGWAEKATPDEGDTVYAPGATYVMGGVATSLYAQYEATLNEATFTYAPVSLYADGTAIELAGTGGSVGATTETVAAASGTPQGSTTTANSNFSFVGWFEAGDDYTGTPVSTATTFVPQKDSTSGLYEDADYVAVFKENADVELRYTVTWVLADGQEMASTSFVNRVSPSSENVAPATGTASGSTAHGGDPGFAFAGWYESGTDYSAAPLSTSLSFVPTRPTGGYVAKTYVAVFKENAAVRLGYASLSLDFDGAALQTPGLGGSVEPGSESVAPVTGAPVGSTASAANPGFSFLGWYLEGSDYTGVPLSASAVFTPSKTEGVYVAANYVAVFREGDSVSITYAAVSIGNDGSAVQAPASGGSVSSTGEIIAPATGAATGSTASAPNAGYSFLGWFVAGANYSTDTPLSTEAAFLPARNTTNNLNYQADYVAVYRENAPVTLSFSPHWILADGQAWRSSDAYGGATPASQTLAPATGVATAVTVQPTNPGWHFAGWYGEGMDFSEEPLSTNLSFTPEKPADVWSATNYTVLYREDADVTMDYSSVSLAFDGTAQSVGNGGTVSSATESAAPFSGNPAGSTATANAGYSFVGWFERGDDYTGTPEATTAQFTPARDATSGLNVGANYVAVFRENAPVMITYAVVSVSNDGSVVQTPINGGSVSSTGETLAPATGEASGSTASAPNAGYGFVGWFAAGSNYLTDTPLSTEQAFVPERNASDGLNFQALYMAVYRENAHVALSYAVLTTGFDGQIQTATNGGTITATDESVAPATGTPVGSTATANPGYTFKGWCTDGSDPTGTLLTEEACLTPVKHAGEGCFVSDNYIALFVENADVTISYGTATDDATSPGIGGTVTVATEEVAPASGTAEGTRAVVNPGYLFEGWYLADDTEYENRLSTDPVFIPGKTEGIYSEGVYVARFILEDTGPGGGDDGGDDGGGDTGGGGTGAGTSTGGTGTTTTGGSGTTGGAVFTDSTTLSTDTASTESPATSTTPTDATDSAGATGSNAGTDDSDVERTTTGDAGTTDAGTAGAATSSSTSWALLNLLFALGGIALAIATPLLRKKDRRTARNNTLSVVAAALALLSIIVFFLTENLTSPMVFADMWTILSVALFIVEVVVLAFATKAQQEEDRGRTPRTHHPPRYPY